MLSFRKNPLVNQVVGMWGSRQSFPVVDFPPGEVVTPPGWLNVYPWGAYLRVPLNTCAVIITSSNRPWIFPAGDHQPQLATGLYPIQFVDLRRHTLNLPDVCAASVDAWDVHLSLAVIWRVIHPGLVIDAPRPLEAITKACTSVVMDFIQSNPHDGLVCAPGATPISGAEIAETLQNNLLGSRACQGFEILEVIVLNRVGDRRRTEAVQHAIVEKTVIEQQKLLQQAKMDLTSEALAQEQQLAQQRQELAVKEAEITRLKIEEEERVRLRKAEITANEAHLLRDSQMQQIEMQNLAKMQENEHEEVLRSMEVRADAFARLAEAIVKEERLQGLQRGTDGDMRESLVRAIEMLAANMPGPDRNVPMLIPNTGETETLSLRDRLASELAAVLCVPGTRCDALQTLAPDRFLVTVHYLKLRIGIECGPDYPDQPPTRIAVSIGGHTTLQSVDIPWGPGSCLRDVIFEVTNQIMNKTTQANFEPEGDGAQKSKPLAI